MKRLSLLLIAVLGTVHAMAAVVLPIEVLGEPGHIETVEIPLPDGSPAVTAMSLRVHALNAQNKMSIRINDSPDWITLHRGNVTFPFPDGKFHGMSGAQATIRMVVPLPSGLVRAGKNTVRFRFNDEDGVSIGYRVLGFNFMAGPESQPLVPESEFVQEDPSAWRSPLDSADAIAEGKKLWYSAPLWDGGRPIRASCSDCHAHDGRDLKYFNYSNKSIVERSIYHRLTRDQGTRIASYIRSLPIAYEEKGRPWNPPYQPGPGLDSKPVRSWAAGAGLEWVLDRDYDTLKYIFPDDASFASFSYSNTLNTREVPIFIQYPDWNHWLPTVHPLDACVNLGVSPDVIAPFVSYYSDLRTAIANRLKELPKAEAMKRSMTDFHETWSSKLQPFRNLNFETYSTKTGPSIRAIAHWHVIKIWEIMHEFELEAEGKGYFGPRANERTWFTGQVFRLAPHLLKTPANETWEFESMQWYQLQLTLNDGNRKAVDTNPIDWGYLVALGTVRSPYPANFSILIINMIKSGEATYDFPNLNPVISSNAGWYANFGFPEIPLRRGQWFLSEIDRIDPSAVRRVCEAMTRTWLEKARQFSPQEFRDKGWGDDSLQAAIAQRFSMLPVALERVGANPELIQEARDFAISVTPSLSTKPPAPTNLQTFKRY